MRLLMCLKLETGENCLQRVPVSSNGESPHIRVSCCMHSMAKMIL
jgi:hypothetical protein